MPNGLPYVPPPRMFRRGRAAEFSDAQLRNIEKLHRGTLTKPTGQETPLPVPRMGGPRNPGEMLKDLGLSDPLGDASPGGKALKAVGPLASRMGFGAIKEAAKEVVQKRMSRPPVGVVPVKSRIAERANLTDQNIDDFFANRYGIGTPSQPPIPPPPRSGLPPRTPGGPPPPPPPGGSSGGPQRPEMSRGMKIVNEVLSFPRAIISGPDVSFPFRQGITTLSRPEFYKSFKPMIKSFVSEKGFKEVQDSIKRIPSIKTFEKSGGALTNVGKKMNKREEQFMSTWADKVGLPYWRKEGKLQWIRPWRASARAYAAFGNNLRATLFHNLSRTAVTKGAVDVTDEPALKKFSSDLAKYVNDTTGRGTWDKKHDGILVALNGAMFSPRLFGSRVNMIRRVIDPVMYAKTDPFVRKQALRDMVALSTFAGTTAFLGNEARKAAGYEGGVDLDPRSADFMKLRLGDTRVDLTGGFQQYVRVAAQFMTGKYKQASGRVVPVQRGVRTRGDILGDFARSKAAPVPGAVWDWAEGEDFRGDEFEWGKTAKKLVTPIMIQDFNELMEQDPELAALVVPAAIGFGVQTYAPRQRGSGRGGRARRRGRGGR